MNVQGGLYGKPRQDGTPLYGGLDLSHSRRIKNFDLTVGLIHSWTTGIGRIITIAVSGRWESYVSRSPGTRLNYGVNVNYLYNDYTGFFIWRSPEELYSISAGEYGTRENTFYIDPFLNYTNSEKGTTHRFKGRFFHRGSRIITHTTDKSLF